MTYTPDSLKVLLAASPDEKRRRQAAAQRICAIGAQDAERKLRYQTAARHSVQSEVAIRATSTSRQPDAKTYATTAISYPAHVAHYFKQHDITWHTNNAINGRGYRKVNSIAIILQAQRAQ